MPVTFVGVRHHSPACAHLVRRTIEALRPAYVLVEGPVDFNGRIGELLLGHEFPIAVFSHFRHESHSVTSWAPLCEYSPEWTAISAGSAAGAEVRFIDLPTWHPAFGDRVNRFADAERRYGAATVSLCEAFAVDNIDALWDHMVEVAPQAELEDRLASYFDLIRGDSPITDGDAAREEYMARWVRAAAAHAGGEPIVVVTGGFHTPALRRLAANDDGAQWPEVPRPPEGGLAGSFLVPFSFRRLDSFAGYQSGMPSPQYYQRLWRSGPRAAADDLTRRVATRLRKRGLAVSTADLVAARTLTEGLARLRGHDTPVRTDLLDGLAAALVNEDLEQPLPWTGRGALSPGTHPVVVEMVAAFSGDRVGRLHPGTPAPPLVHDVTATLERENLDGDRRVVANLTLPAGLRRSRILHRLRILDIPGVKRHSGPSYADQSDTTERWQLVDGDDRGAALIEAGAYGADLAAAAAALLDERIAADDRLDALSQALFDAVLTDSTGHSRQITAAIARRVGDTARLADLGAVLTTVVGLWRHDGLFGTARSPLLGEIITTAVPRALWLAEGMRGAGSPTEPDRLLALVAVRDALRHTGTALGLDREAALAVMARVAGAADAPPDLRGAAFGLGWSLGAAADPVAALRGASRPDTIGDWLAGLFALAREKVVAAEDDAVSEVIATIDRLVVDLDAAEFLVALPALRQAFEYFPPRERDRIAASLLRHRGLSGSARSLRRTTADPLLIAAATVLEDTVDEVLGSAGLLAAPESGRECP